MYSLITYRHVLNRSDDRLKLLLFELLLRFDDLFERCDFLSWLSCLIETIEQFVSLRHTFAAHLNGIVLFRGNGKNAACLKSLLRLFPPALPFRLGENVAYQ